MPLCARRRRRAAVADVDGRRDVPARAVFQAVHLLLPARRVPQRRRLHLFPRRCRRRARRARRAGPLGCAGGQLRRCGGRGRGVRGHGFDAPRPRRRLRRRRRRASAAPPRRRREARGRRHLVPRAADGPQRGARRRPRRGPRRRRRAAPRRTVADGRPRRDEHLKGRRVAQPARGRRLCCHDRPGRALPLLGASQAALRLLRPGPRRALLAQRRARSGPVPRRRRRRAHLHGAPARVRVGAARPRTPRGAAAGDAADAARAFVRDEAPRLRGRLPGQPQAVHLRRAALLVTRQCRARPATT
mmetsp:Transcript_27845/g.93653  ORF Transcript_27845/g.93653 Transcript_27845/m.93653 type:complete len:302 (+) Transcript_27845:215-1120(+)